MDLEFIVVLVNLGLVMLGWIAQIVIYPGLLYYSEENLKKWHGPYASRITLFAFPLMTSQLGLYAFSAYKVPGILSFMVLTLVICSWLTTFRQAVPLHSEIGKSSDSTELRKKLIRVNWIRTVIWTIIFIISIIVYGK